MLIKQLGNVWVAYDEASGASCVGRIEEHARSGMLEVLETWRVSVAEKERLALAKTEASQDH